MENNHGKNTQNYGKTDDIVSVKEWLISLLIMFIPIVNVVMMFVWAFGTGTKTSKANFFKANLVFVAINIVLVVMFWGSLFGAIVSGL